MPRPLRRIDRLRQIERPIGDAAPPPTLVGELVEHRRPSRVPALGRHAVHETPRALRRDLNAASREPSVKSDGGIALYRTDPLKIPVVALTTAVVSPSRTRTTSLSSQETTARDRRACPRSRGSLDLLPSSRSRLSSFGIRPQDG